MLKRLEVSSRIYRINKSVTGIIRDAIREYDLTPSQWMVLKRLSESDALLNQQELAEACSKDSATITRMLDSMEKKNYLERIKSGDRRKYLIKITGKGEELFRKGYASIENAQESYSSIFEEDEWDTLIEMLDKLDKSLRNQ